MKKILLSASFLCLFTAVKAQTNVFSFGFDGTDAAMVSAGWAMTNQSEWPTETLWSIAPYAAPLQNPIFGSTTPVGHEGGANSFAVVNYTSVDFFGDISNWLITPVINVQNGDVVSFYTRTGADETGYADRLELRMSTSGASSVIPSSGETDLGSFTNLLVTVNPNLNLTDYPNQWAQFTATISGLTGSTAVRFAFRYEVPLGGEFGDNSDIIGIDTFSVTRAAAGTDDFVKNNFSIYPNPATDVLNLNAISNASINSISITDVNGRTVKQQQIGGVSSAQINVNDLTAGVYFVSVNAAEGNGTVKFVKK